MTPRIPSPEEVTAAMPVNGGSGWSKERFASWGVSWPPTRGWRRRLREQYEAMNEPRLRRDGAHALARADRSTQPPECLTSFQANDARPLPKLREGTYRVRLVSFEPHSHTTRDGARAPSYSFGLPLFEVRFECAGGYALAWLTRSSGRRQDGTLSRFAELCQAVGRPTDRRAPTQPEELLGRELVIVVEAGPNGGARRAVEFLSVPV